MEMVVMFRNDSTRPRQVAPSGASAPMRLAFGILGPMSPGDRQVQSAPSGTFQLALNPFERAAAETALRLDPKTAPSSGASSTRDSAHGYVTRLWMPLTRRTFVLSA
jgi:hypothetical protein